MQVCIKDLTADQFINLLNKVIDFRGDGVMIWKYRSLDMCASLRSQSVWNVKFAGKPLVPQKAKIGYMTICIFNQKIYLHKVIWVMANKRYPVERIDHIDGNRLNNSLDNLREVSHADNCRNVGTQADTISKSMGVRQHKTGRWSAYINPNKKQIHLGMYDEKEQAIKAFQEAAKSFGFHENHGKRFARDE